MIRRFFIYLCILAVVGGIAAYVVIKDFAGSPWPPDIALAAFEPVTPAPLTDTRVWTPRFPVIDVHSHPQQSGLSPDELANVMDAAGVAVVVDLDGNWGRAGERLTRVKEAYDLKHADRFLVFVTLELYKLGSPDFVEKECRKLEAAAALGVRGIKVYKHFGTNWRDTDGNLIPVDDPRLDPVWRKAGELGMPIIMHTANPVAFWSPTDRFNERYEELYAGGSWLESYYEKPGAPSFDALMQQRRTLLERHPQTVFIGAHMGELGHDLKRLGDLFDTFPNFYVDISDRAYELGRQPYTAREFFIKYEDRLLFGIDLYSEVHVYQRYYRFLESRDEYFDYPRREYNHGRWKIYGLDLPDKTLQLVYNGNAKRLFGL